MRAELKRLQSNDHLRWDDFLASPSAEPWDSSGWFSVEIGPDDGIDAGETFQVLVTTPAAVSRVKPARGEFRCVVAPTFEPETILTTLREHVAAISADSWADLRERLRESMWWEREHINVA